MSYLEGLDIYMEYNNTKHLILGIVFNYNVLFEGVTMVVVKHLYTKCYV